MLMYNVYTKLPNEIIQNQLFLELCIPIDHNIGNSQLLPKELEKNLNFKKNSCFCSFFCI